MKKGALSTAPRGSIRPDPRNPRSCEPIFSYFHVFVIATKTSMSFQSDLQFKGMFSSASLLFLSSHTCFGQKQPPLTSPVGSPTLGFVPQRLRATAPCAVALRDHRFHNEVSTRMTDDVSLRLLGLDPKGAETAWQTRPEGDQRAEGVWEMWAACPRQSRLRFHFRHQQRHQL